MANHLKENNVEKYIQWVTTLSLTIRVSSFVKQLCCLPNLRNSRKFELIAVQGHSRSMMLLPIESAYAATSY